MANHTREQKEIKRLNDMVSQLQRDLGQSHHEATLMAKLSAGCLDELMASAATFIRDHILKEQCGINPDGTIIQPAAQPEKGA